MKTPRLPAWAICCCLIANPALASAIDAGILAHHARVLSAEDMGGRRTATPGSMRAQEYIEKVFRGVKLKTFNGQYRFPFTFGNWLSERQGINLMGWVRGTQWPEHYIVVTAHYDHLGSKGTRTFYGADDNASGVAAMLVLAESVSSSPLRHSVIFVATDAEEMGLYGARAFIDSPPVPLMNITLNLNLDMLGVGDGRNRIYIGGGHEAPWRQAVAKVNVAEPVQIFAGYPRQPRGFGRAQKINYRNASDHGAFARRGIPFLFISTGDHRYYHTEDDTFAHLNLPVFYQATVAVWSLLGHVDEVIPRDQKYAN